MSTKRPWSEASAASLAYSAWVEDGRKARQRALRDWERDHAAKKRRQRQNANKSTCGGSSTNDTTGHAILTSTNPSMKIATTKSTAVAGAAQKQHTPRDDHGDHNNDIWNSESVVGSDSANRVEHSNKACNSSQPNGASRFILRHQTSENPQKSPPNVNTSGASAAGIVVPIITAESMVRIQPSNLSSQEHRAGDRSCDFWFNDDSGDDTDEEKANSRPCREARVLLNYAPKNAADSSQSRPVQLAQPSPACSSLTTTPFDDDDEDDLDDEIQVVGVFRPPSCVSFKSSPPTQSIKVIESTSPPKPREETVIWSAEGHVSAPAAQQAPAFIVANTAVAEDESFSALEHQSGLPATLLASNAAIVSAPRTGQLNRLLDVRPKIPSNPIDLSNPLKSTVAFETVRKQPPVQQHLVPPSGCNTQHQLSSTSVGPRRLLFHRDSAKRIDHFTTKRDGNDRSSKSVETPTSIGKSFYALHDPWRGDSPPPPAGDDSRAGEASHAIMMQHTLHDDNSGEVESTLANSLHNVLFGGDETIEWTVLDMREANWSDGAVLPSDEDNHSVVNFVNLCHALYGVQSNIANNSSDHEVDTSAIGWLELLCDTIGLVVTFGLFAPLLGCTFTALTAWADSTLPTAVP